MISSDNTTNFHRLVLTVKLFDMGLNMKLLVVLLVVVAVTSPIVEAGSCSYSFSLCPDPQRKCMSFQAFNDGYQCVSDCDECKRILKEKGVVWGG